MTPAYAKIYNALSFEAKFAIAAYAAGWTLPNHLIMAAQMWDAKNNCAS